MSLLGDLARRRDGHDWCLFVDRDGVINRRVVGDYVRTPAEFELLPGAVPALITLSRWAPRVVIVTNQQGIGKGLYSVRDLDAMHARLLDQVEAGGGRIDAVLVCPHRADDGCSCRKPEPGMALGYLDGHRRARPDLSVMVGDSGSDMEMASRLGAATGHCAAVHICGEQTCAAPRSLCFSTLADLADEVAPLLEGLSP